MCRERAPHKILPMLDLHIHFISNLPHTVTSDCCSVPHSRNLCRVFPSRFLYFFWPNGTQAQISLGRRKRTATRAEGIALRECRVGGEGRRSQRKVRGRGTYGGETFSLGDDSRRVWGGNCGTHPRASFKYAAQRDWGQSNCKMMPLPVSACFR